MGFDGKEVTDALRVNSHQQNAAASGCGARKPPRSWTGARTPQSSFQAALDNPEVQLGLTHPKALLAFEDRLESPLNGTPGMQDPETGPAMLQVSRPSQALSRARVAGSPRLSAPAAPSAADTGQSASPGNPLQLLGPGLRVAPRPPQLSDPAASKLP
ncbi:Ubiquitin-associated domain-containing protein 1 [Plecturocebus cupreus]